MSPRVIATVVLAALGAVLGILADPGQLALYTLAAAAIVAFDARAGLLFGALTLVVGLGTTPVALPFLAPLPAVGAVLAGIALGLLGRELDRHLVMLARDHRPLLIALAALLLVLTFVWPDPHVQLAKDGMPATFDALTIDTGTATRLWRPIPAVVPYHAPLADLEPLVMVLAGIVAFAAMAHTARRAPIDRLLRAVTLGTAAIGGVVALVALLDLLFGSVTLDASLRATLTKHASIAGPVLDIAFPESGALATWSRPWVDGLRLVAALALAYAPFMNAHSQTSNERPWLLLALAVAVLALPFVATPMALAGGVALGLGALVAGRSGSPADLAPRLALVLVALVWVWGALAPA